MSTPSTPLSATTRLIPGAPPPAPSSKSQKKKKSKPSKKASEQEDEPAEVPDTHAAALLDHAPTEDEIKEGSVAPELIVRSTSTRPVSPSGDDKDGKLSALVDMLTKRLKGTNKKVTRIQGYSTTPVEKLNEDQLRSLKTLPVLEGIAKELEEVKKAVEVHEAEVAQEVARVKAEAAKAEEQRVQDAVASAISLHRLRTADLFSLVTLHTGLTNGNPAALTLNLSETEAYAVFSTVESLLGTDSEKKAEVIRGFLSGEGEYQSVPYARLVEITELFTKPPEPQEPVATEPEVVVEFVPVEDPVEELDVVIQGVPASAGASGNFTFVQEDELEVGQEAEDSDDDVEITQTVTDLNIDGRHIIEETVIITSTHEVGVIILNSS
ncbi:hypothetical protein BDY19DRAFT_201224 [Irpex rosettiformis]|uniref:Uncharacterized protein n=1 Tax=Irpex rosettiformis TaxID=378272 RepID=A0ACB8U141_9APHY|nr:hypothetical protein BDY19DRAFT_201224 [Irpex rosettiformis]